VSQKIPDILAVTQESIVGMFFDTKCRSGSRCEWLPKFNGNYFSCAKYKIHLW